MGNRGSLIVISGFSGVGKGTVVKRLVSDYGYELSISATTRSPRAGEEHGREYFFMDKSEFENLIDYGGFIEWTQYVENYYGTPRKFVEESLDQGKNIILEIEVMGAMKIKEQYPDALVGYEQNGQFEFYGEDARKICELTGGKLLERETALGTVLVTGFPREQWVYRAKQLWECGENIYLAGLNEDGTHHQTKYLRREEYLPVGSIVHMEGQ